MNDRHVDFLLSIAFYGLIICGFLGIVTALLALATMQLLPAGLAILSAAACFGVIALVILRR